MKNIVFDVDDTVYDQQLPFQQAIQNVFSHVKSEDVYPLYIQFRFRSDETFEKVTSKAWSIECMRIYRIREALKDLGYAAPDDQKAVLFQQAYEEELAAIQVHPEIAKILDFLVENNIPLGLITNGPTTHQHRKIKQLELEKWLPKNRMIISESVGCQKPEKEIFQLAAEQFNMEPSKTLYIGDSFENDVVGAKNGGWHSLWFNHRLRNQPENEPATHIKEVRSFEALFDAIQEILTKNESKP